MINKVRELSLRLLEDKVIGIFLSLIAIIWLAFNFSTDVKTANDYWTGKERFSLLSGTAFLLLLTIGIIKLLYKRKKYKTEGIHTYRTAEYNEKAYALAYETVNNYKRSEAFNHIVNTHRDNVRDYFNDLISTLQEKINSHITEETLRGFDKVKNNVEGQKAMISSVFREFANIPAIESYLTGQHRNCLSELRNDLLKKIRSNALFASFTHFRNNKGEGPVTAEFDLDAADIAFEIDSILKQIPELSFQNLLSKEKQDNDMTIAGLMAAGMTADDIAHILSDVIGGESADYILHELMEYAGTFIPVIGQVFVVIKIFKFLYAMRDRAEDLQQLRTEIYQSSLSFYQGISKRASAAIYADSSLYMEKLSVSFKDNYERARKFKKRSEWYK
jgi:hypothetical protein